MKKIFYTFSTALLFLSWVTLTYATESELNKNKKVVTHFYEMAFNDHKPEEAIKKFVGLQYIQHNPFVADGKKPFIDFFVPYLKDHPQSRITIKRVIAEGDLVMLHVHSQLTPQDPGRAVMDIFRIKDGKIVEHWDTAQPVHEHPLNSNTMF